MAAQIGAACCNATPVPFDYAGLLNQGTPISITDVFIAATGLRHKWTVVTDNTKDFRRIDGLALEDWRLS